MADDHAQRPTADDTGKPVVTADGTQVGVITAVSGDTVSVDPTPGIAEELRTLLGGDTSNGAYELDAAALTRDPSADVAVFRVDRDDLDG